MYGTAGDGTTWVQAAFPAVQTALVHAVEEATGNVRTLSAFAPLQKQAQRPPAGTLVTVTPRLQVPALARPVLGQLPIDAVAEPTTAARTSRMRERGAI
jgi:hypothetical protein